jgi:Putative DNA-binding domain
MKFDAPDPPRRLLAFQGEFAAALLDAEPRIPPIVSRTTDADATRRFGIYRNNVSASLSAALAARFPVVERLVGGGFFRAMALRFVEHHPPRSPVLSAYGAVFPDFLDSFEPVASLPYISDVARLEWARAVAYHAADDRPVDISVLSSIPPERLHGARLTLHASVFVVASDYPIVSIWRTNTHDDPVREIGPDLPGEVALVSRPALDVMVTPLPRGAAQMIARLAQDGTLGAAALAATEEDPKLKLSDALALLFGAGAVIHVEGGP